MLHKPCRFLVPIVLLLTACTHQAGLNVRPQAKTSLTVYSNVVYGTDSPAQDMDVFLPANRDTVHTPVVVLIHGGSWVQGDKTDFQGSGIDTFFAANGCAVMTINYRLDGTYQYPAPLEDVGLVLDYVKKKKTEWRINPDRVCLMGKSSGSQLALLYAYSRNQDGRVKAVIDGYGPTDLTDSSLLNSGLAINVQVLLGPYATNRQAWHDASPIFFMAGSVPTVIFQGTQDQLVEPMQSQLLVDSLAARGKPYMFIPWVGDGHGWDQVKWMQWRSQVMAWIKYFL